MGVDFRDAASRHWEDAGHLLNGKRLANADHLCGIAAECALKTIMMALGMTLKPGGKPVEPEGQNHINKLWIEFISFAQARGGSKYAAMIDPTINPFDDWKVDQRYEHRSIITDAKVENHRKAAENIMAILDMAILDGAVK